MVILLLINLLVVGVAGLVGKALFTTIVLDSKVNNLKSVAAKQADADVDAAPGLVQSYGALGDNAGVLADALPASIDFPSLIVTLENMGNVAGLRFKSIASADVATVTGATADASSGTAAAPATQDSAAAPKPQLFAFSLTASSSYDSVLKLLHNIETSARPMRVLDVQFTGTGSSLNTQIDVMTYYQDKAKLPFSTESVK